MPGTELMYHIPYWEGMTNTAVVWFRTDLRLHDNPVGQYAPAAPSLLASVDDRVLVHATASSALLPGIPVVTMMGFVATAAADFEGLVAVAMVMFGLILAVATPYLAVGFGVLFPRWGDGALPLPSRLAAGLLSGTTIFLALPALTVLARHAVAVRKLIAGVGFSAGALLVTSWVCYRSAVRRFAAIDADDWQ